MSTMICPNCRVAAFYAEEDDAAMTEIQMCIWELRSQGFQIHDFGKPGSREDYLKRIRKSSVILVFATPQMKRNGDVHSVSKMPEALEILRNKPCIPVMVRGNAENAVPAWAEGPVVDCRQTKRSMWTSLGVILRRVEFRNLVAFCDMNGREKLCLDSISVNRTEKQDRFILYGRKKEEFVRIILALGPEMRTVQPFPEWIIYEDPDDFLPDQNGKVTVKLAHIGEQDRDRYSENYGAYYLGKPIDVRIPEGQLCDPERSELIRAASVRLRKMCETNHGIMEANPDDLRLMDMELDPFIPDERTIHECNLTHKDQQDMREAISFWMRPPLTVSITV